MAEIHFSGDYLLGSCIRGIIENRRFGETTVRSQGLRRLSCSRGRVFFGRFPHNSGAKGGRMSSAGWLTRVVFVLALVFFNYAAFGQATKKPAAKKTPQLSDELKQFDANGDGKLDANERKAALAAKRSGATAKAKADATQPVAAATGNGSPAIDPTQDPLFAKRFDLDGDGQLDENETQAMQSEIARMRAVGSNGGQPPGGLPPGGPPPGGPPPSGTTGPAGPQGSGGRMGFGGGGPGGPGGDRQARFQEMVKKYDSNGDGQLDDSERTAMQATMEKLRGEMMQKYDTNGDGQLDDNERQARDASRLQQYDSNGDGQIDEQERAAMPEYERVRGSRRGGGGPGGPGGFGGGPGGFRGNFGGGPLPDFMKQYDTNGDGQLNEQEQVAMQTAMRADFEKRPAEQIKKYDKNGDGQLNEKEQAAVQADYDKLRAEMMKKYDTNGDGNLDENERTVRDASRLKTYDRNSDGKLDESETASMPEFERVRGGRSGSFGGGGFGGPGGGFGSGGYARGGGSPGASTDGSASRVRACPAM